VQDLLPSFKAGRSNAEILEWYPQLTSADVGLLRQYYLDHTAEVLEAEAKIAALHADLRRRYDHPSDLDNLPAEERRAFLMQKAAERRAEANGVQRPAR
jgi:hypothetical protein